MNWTLPVISGYNLLGIDIAHCLSPSSMAGLIERLAINSHCFYIVIRSQGNHQQVSFSVAYCQFQQTELHKN